MLSPVVRPLIVALTFLGTVIMAHCISRRVTAELHTVKSLRSVPPARWFLLLALVNALVFSLVCNILTFGIGLNKTPTLCTISHATCVLFYLFCRVFIYGFLIEKVHLAWGSALGYSRLRSPVYLLCLASMTAFLALCIFALTGGRNHVTRDDGLCYFKMRVKYSIPLMAYSIFFSLLLCSFFVIPLWSRLSKMNAALRLIIIRVLVASGVSLTASFISILMVVLMSGTQLAWVCTISCYVDTIVSAVAMYWAAPAPAEEEQGKSDNPTIITQFPSTNDVEGGSLYEVELALKKNGLDRDSLKQNSHGCRPMNNE